MGSCALQPVQQQLITLSAYKSNSPKLLIQSTVTQDTCKQHKHQSNIRNHARNTKKDEACPAVCYSPVWAWFCFTVRSSVGPSLSAFNITNSLRRLYNEWAENESSTGLLKQQTTAGRSPPPAVYLDPACTCWLQHYGCVRFGSLSVHVGRCVKCPTSRPQSVSGAWRQNCTIDLADCDKLKRWPC